MEKSIAKTLLVKFLKVNKIMGTTLLYFYGKPIDKCIAKTNCQVLELYARRVDNAIEQGNITQIKTCLISMLGACHDAKLMVKIEGDRLYDIYIEWENYVRKLDINDIIFIQRLT